MHPGSILLAHGLSTSWGEPGPAASNDQGVPKPTLQCKAKTGPQKAPVPLNHPWSPPWTLRTYGADRSMGQRRSLVDPVPRSRVPEGSRGTTAVIQLPVGVLPWPHTQGETQLPPRHGVDGPGNPAYLDIPVDHLVPRQPPVQAVAGREVQADVVPAGLEESTMGASSCSWRCHSQQRVYQCCPHPQGGGSPHLWGVVQQELAAELHHVTFQCKR